MQKTIVRFAIFLIILGFIGFYLFRAMDWADKNKNESAAICTILEIVAVQKTFNQMQKISEYASLQELLEKK